jgi:hypothetical protein
MTRFGAPSFALLSVVLVTGCASQPIPHAGASATQADAGQPQRCVKEYRVGSNIPVMNCSAPQTEEERRRMVDDLRNQTRTSGGSAARPGP